MSNGGGVGKMRPYSTQPLAIALVICSAVSPSFAIQYRLTDLGTDGGSTSSAYDINASGQVVGTSDTTGDNTVHGVLYDHGTKTAIGTLGGPFSQAYGINDSGQIVGSTSHAFLSSNGVMTDLKSFNGATAVSAEARSINGMGQIVGASFILLSSSTHAFLYEAGHMTDLLTFGGLNSKAFDIND